MNKLQIRHALVELAEQEAPAGLDLWPRVKAHAGHGGGRSGWTRWSPHSRAGWAGLALAGLLVLSATAYAASPVISRLLTMDEQFRDADAQRLGQSLDLSQTIGDVTVTAQWAYADDQRVLIGYTIKTADGRRFDPAGVSVTDATGAALHTTGGYGVVGHSDLLGVSLPPGESTNVAIFDSPAKAAGQPPSLKLHLTVYAAEYWLPTEAPTPVVAGNIAQAQPVTVLATSGPFELDFEVLVRGPR
jgi:hypothetical protein